MTLTLKFFNKDYNLLKTISCFTDKNIENIEEIQEVYINLFQKLSDNSFGFILSSDFIQYNKILYKLYNSTLNSEFSYIEYYLDNELIIKGKIKTDLTTYSLENNISDKIFEKLSYYI